MCHTAAVFCKPITGLIEHLHVLEHLIGHFLRLESPLSFLNVLLLDVSLLLIEHTILLTLVLNHLTHRHLVALIVTIEVARHCKVSRRHRLTFNWPKERILSMLALLAVWARDHLDG